MTAFKALIREASELGAVFRLSGAEV